MKKLLIFLIVVSLSGTLAAQNWYQYIINANGGVTIGKTVAKTGAIKAGSNVKKIDSLTVVTNTVHMYNGATDLTLGSGGIAASDTATMLSPYARKKSPTFTGVVTLPTTTAVGDVSSTELQYVNGVTSGIQAQLDAKGGALATSLGLHNDGTLISSAEMTDALQYCETNNVTLLFTPGTYRLPYDFETDAELTNIYMEGIGEVVITSYNAGDANSIRKPAKIDLKIDPANYDDGIYRVAWTQLDNDDGEGYHASYPSGLILGDYVLITAGVPTERTLTQVKTANWMTYVDLDAAEPTQAGIYEVSKGNIVSGGGYPNIDLTWEAGVKVAYGATVLNTAGTWTRYNNKNGFRFKGNLYVKNIHFDQCAFFLFDFRGKTIANKTIDIRDCEFTNIRRVFAADHILSADSWNDEGYIFNKTIEDKVNYTFEKIIFKDNTFKLIGEGIMWGCPTYKSFYFDNNIIEDCDNYPVLLNLNQYTNAVDTFYAETAVAMFTNNKIMNCVSPGVTAREVAKVIIRVQCNALIDHNFIQNVNGFDFYLGGGNNAISNNYVDQNIDLESDYSNNGVILEKAIDTRPNHVYGNIIARSNSHFISSIADQDWVVHDNYFVNHDYVEPQFSLTTTLDRNTSYTVRALTAFRTVAVDYDATIADDDNVYFNKMNNRWEIKQGDNTTDKVFYFEQSDAGAVTGKLLSYNNTFKAADFIGTGGNHLMQDLYFETRNDIVSLNGFLTGAQYVGRKFTFGEGTKIRLNNESAMINTHYVDTLEFEGCEFYGNTLTKLTIKHDGNLTFNRVKFRADPLFYKAAWFTDDGTSAKTSAAMVVVTCADTLHKVTFNDCEFDLSIARNYCIDNVAFDTVIINGGKYNFNMLDRNVTDTYAYVVHNSTYCPTFVELNGLTIECDDNLKQNHLISITKTGYPFPVVNVANIRIKEGDKLQGIFYSQCKVTTMSLWGKELMNAWTPYNFATITTRNEYPVKSYYLTDLSSQDNAASSRTEVDATTSWSASGVTLTSDNEHTWGAKAIKLVSADGSFDYGKISFTAEVGRNYRIRYAAKRGTGSSQYAEYWAGVVTSPAQAFTTSWAEYANTITASSTTVELRFYAAESGSANDILYIDNLRIEREDVAVTASMIYSAAGDTSNVSYPSKIGDIFIDTSASKVYVAKSTARGGWLILNSIILLAFIVTRKRKF